MAKKKLVTIEAYREDGKIRGGCSINFKGTPKELAQAIGQSTRGLATVAATYGHAFTPELEAAFTVYLDGVLAKAKAAELDAAVA